MQFTITINQAKALDWGLNAQQALLFAFVYGCPSWAQPIERNGEVFYALSKAKITEELPLLTEKPDTAYRMLKALAAAGLIELSSTSSITLVRLTEKAKEWNRKRDGSDIFPTRKPEEIGQKSEVGKSSVVGKKSDAKRAAISEKNPSMVGKISEGGRKNIRARSEKSPTNQDTSNQDTNQDTSHNLRLASPESPQASEKSQAENDRQEACRAIWTAYSSAYLERYETTPVRNAKVNRQVDDLRKRLGSEAPAVAGFFVWINDQYLIRCCHDFGSLLAKAEAYRTQWATNRQVTSATARQAENTQSNLSAAEQALAEQRARRNAHAHG